MSSRKRVRRTIAVLLASATAMGMTVMSGAASASAATQASPKEPSQAQWQQLDRVARSNKALGVYGLTDTVLMLPAGTSAAKKAQVQSEIPAGMKVAVKISEFTKSTVDNLQKEVMKGKWTSNPSRYAIVAAYDGQKDKLVTSLEAPKSVGYALERKYGDAVEAQPGRVTPEATRFTDVSPFWGGGSIQSGTGTCTAGWAIKNKASGKHYMVTTSHCAPLNTNFYTQQGKFFGAVTKLDNSLDAEALSGKDYGARLFSGGTQDSSSALYVDTWTGWTYLGRKTCVSGRTTYNHCGHPVSLNSMSISYDFFGVKKSIRSTAVFLTDRGGNSCCPGKFTAPGDSGAPVYVDPTHNGGVNMVGIHHGKVFWNFADRMANIHASDILSSFNSEMIVEPS